MTQATTEFPKLSITSPESGGSAFADLSRLAQEASPWVALPTIDRALERTPGDLGIALLGVRTLAALGLRTPALERLGALNASADHQDDLRTLRSAVEALPPDMIPLSRRLKMAERNVEALAGNPAQGIDLGEAFAQWREGESGWEHLRALGGNVVRRPVGATLSASWLWVGDLRDGMASFVEKTYRTINPDRRPRITIEGVNPPWLLLAVAAINTPTAFGYTPRMTLLQEDANEFFEGASVADLRGLLSSPTLRCFIGPDATERYRRDALAHLDEEQGGIGMASNTVRRKCEPDLPTTIRGIAETQRSETERLHEEVCEIYRGRDARWWSARYAEALRPGSAEPLRVLIPSCRFTTYVRHAARSLGDALNRLGCEAEVLIETDDSANISEWAYQHRFAAFRPDLVVLVNYTRSERGRTIPRGVPMVTWAQDGMPHLFERTAGAAQGELDFVVGHVYHAMLTGFGFRADRALRFPVVADAQVFAPTGFIASASTPYDAEVAYVSHHSESPQSMLERLIREDGGRNEALLRSIATGIERLLGEASRSAFRQPLRRLIDRQVREGHPGPDHEGVAARTFHQFAIPLAERMIRHEMIGWASRTAARRGWRFALFGKGWEDHPEFCDLARGPMEHGSALRDCYERCAAHLHASVCNPAHQRVQECALAGGLPLCRVTRDSLQVEYELMRLGAMGEIEPSMIDERQDLVGFRVADHPELMAIEAQLQRMGMSMEEGPDPSMLWIERAEWERRGAATEIPTIDTRTRWLLGDLGQCAFTDESGLERLLVSAVERPEWRREVGGGVASRVKERLTIDGVAAQLLSFVRRGIDTSAGRGG